MIENDNMSKKDNDCNDDDDDFEDAFLFILVPCLFLFQIVLDF